MDLVRFLRSNPIVSNVAAYSDVLSELSDAFSKPLVEVDSAEEFAQWYLAYELSLVRGQSNTDFIRSDQKETRISILLGRTTSNQIKALEQLITEWHQKNNNKFSLTVTGENIPVAHLSELNIRSMIGGLGISIAVVAFLVALLARNARIGLVALAGALAPLTFGFGVWGLLGNDIGLASTAIIALTVGVAIDDAVHMLYRFVDGRERLSLGRWEAAAYSVHRAGTAIVTTSIVMIGGLCVLLLSSFNINSSFGAVTSLIIALALVFDLLILPRLLIWAEPDSEAKN
jgi:predicted RND superfamily exporter protein